MRTPIPKLVEYLKTLTPEQRSEFAVRCETTAGHLRNVADGWRPCGEKLAIAIDRESGGAVLAEDCRPDVDWAHLRGSSLVIPESRVG